MLISQTEVLKKLMSQLHQLIHSRIVLLVIRYLKKIENDYVNSDVPQQSLFVFSRLRSAQSWCDAKFVHAN